MQPGIKEYFNQDVAVAIPVRDHVDKEFYETLPKRPMEEISLAKQDIYCNAFKVNFEEMHLISYEARFSPESDNSALKRALLISHFHKKVITDGRMVSLPKEVPEGEKIFSIIARNGTKFTVELAKANGTDQLDVQKSNMLLKSIIIEGNRNMISWRKSFFDFEHRETKRSGSEEINILPGFSSTVQIFDDKSYIVVDKSFRVLRTSTYLQTLSGKSQDVIKKEFQPCVLYNKITKRLEKIDEISFEMTPLSTFKRKDGSEISIKQYYTDKYTKIVTDDGQPILIQKKIEKDSEGKEVVKQPAYFVPEFMCPTGMTDAMRADNRLNQDMASIFHADPREKMRSLKEIATNMSNIVDMKNWRIDISTEPAKFSSFKLPQPSLIFKDNKIEPDEKRDWNRLLKNVSYINMKPLTKWTAFMTESSRDDFNKFEGQLSNYYRRIRVDYARPVIKIITGTQIEGLEDSTTGDDLVFAVTQPDSVYETIKKFCVNKHIPTQCIKPNTLRRPTLTPVITMITLQMQGKMGGVPWKVDVDPIFADGMTVGIDVISAGKDREIVGIVSSVDKEFTVYKKNSVVEKKGLHLSGIHIDEFMRDAFEEYKKMNGAYPKKLVVYRGTVNSGDLKNLKNGEIAVIKKTVEAVAPTTEFVYITVNNKHDMKFFAKDQNDFMGPLPGTVISEGVIKNDLFQFYLVSHVPKKGMVKPSLYFVLENSFANINQSALFNFTYQLAHLYFNGTNSVCFPTSLYQANKFCKMLNECGYVEGTRKKQQQGGSGRGRGYQGTSLRGRGSDRRDFREDNRRVDYRDDRRGADRRDDRRDDYRRDDRHDDYRRDADIYRDRRDDYRDDRDSRRDERRDDRGYRRDDKDDYRRDDRDYRRDDRQSERRDDYRRDSRYDDRRDSRDSGRRDDYRRDTKYDDRRDDRDSHRDNDYRRDDKRDDRDRRY